MNLAADDTLMSSVIFTRLLQGITSPVLQVEKPKFQEVKSWAQGSTAGTWCSRDCTQLSNTTTFLVRLTFHLYFAFSTSWMTISSQHLREAKRGQGQLTPHSPGASPMQLVNSQSIYQSRAMAVLIPFPSGLFFSCPVLVKAAPVQQAWWSHIWALQVHLGDL